MLSFVLLALLVSDEPLVPAENARAVGDDTATDAQREHWSFRPVLRPALPAVMRAEWARNPIDRFILARLEQTGLMPSPEADRTTLIRRLYYDLIGLPPTPEEVAAFCSDDSSDAFERLVDQLLSSPHLASAGRGIGSMWCGSPKATALK